MRNLKRALSLALASVMVMGLMVVGTGASYSDVTSEQNQEAIEVLQAVGIMVGDENGKFNPGQNVTRNEMAVIMANMMDYRVASYKGTSPFTDVPSWAEPYVAACYTNKIVAGMSATTYGGDQSVTAAQAALMMMKALGYFQYQSDFEDDWQLATVRQANKIELFEDVDAGVTEAMTRNDVAQLALNTLKGTMVENDGEGQVTVSGEGFTVTTGKTSYSEVLSTDKVYSRIDSWKNYDNKYSVELGEKLYQGDLRLTGNSDDFGRPASVWSYKNDEIGTYPDTAEETWTAKVTEKALYNAAGSTAVNDYKWFVYVDGVKTAFDPADLSKNSTDRVLKSGNGVLSQVYVDSLAGEVVLTMINTYVAEVSKVVENDDDYTVTVNFKAQPAALKSIDREFDTDVEYAKEDIVLVTVANDAIKSMAKAETVEGTVNTVKSNDYLKLDGTTYNYNYAYTVDSVIRGYDGKDAKGLWDLDQGEGANPEAGNKATIYLDSYGNAIAIEKTDVSVDDYLYIKGLDSAYGDVSAKVVFSDGTEGKIDIDELDNVKVKSTGVLSEDTVYKFAKSGSKYDLTSVNKIDTKRTGTQVTDKLVITKDSASFNAVNASNSVTATFSANSNTVYVDVDNNKVFTGYRNVPGMTSAKGGYVVMKNSVTEIVFLKDAGKYDMADDSFFFVKSTGDVSVTDTEDGKFYEWTVFVNGVKETLTMTKGASDEIKANGVGMYSIESTDKHDYVDDVEFKVGGTNLSSYAETAEKEVLILNSTAGDKTGATTPTRTFAYDSSKTTFMVVELKNGKPDGDNIYAGSVSNIETDAKGRTGVYVMNAEDKDTANKTPLATLVLVIVPEDDSKPSGGSGSGTSVTATVSYTNATASSGNVTANFTLDNIAAWVDTGDKIAITADVYVSGAYVGPFSVKMNAGITSQRLGAAVPGINAGDVVELRNITATPDSVKVRYLDVDNNVYLSADAVKQADGSAATSVLSTTTAAAIKFNVNTTDAAVESKVTYTVEGLTADVTTATAVGDNTTTTISSKQAKGTGYVTVKLTGLNKLSETVKLTVPASAALSTLDTTYATATVKDYTFVLSTTAGTNSSNDYTGIRKGAEITVTGTLNTAIPLANDGVKVTLSNGETMIFVNNNSTKTADIKVKMDGDVSLTVTKVEDVAGPKVKSIVVNNSTQGALKVGDTITVTFDQKLDAAPTFGKAASADLAVGTGVLAADGMSVTYTVTTAPSAAVNGLKFAANAAKSDATGITNKAAISINFTDSSGNLLSTITLP